MTLTLVREATVVRPRRPRGKRAAPPHNLSVSSILRRVGGKRCSCAMKVSAERTSERVGIQGRTYQAARCLTCRGVVGWRLARAPQRRIVRLSARERAGSRWVRPAHEVALEQAEVFAQVERAEAEFYASVLSMLDAITDSDLILLARHVLAECRSRGVSAD